MGQKLAKMSVASIALGFIFSHVALASTPIPLPIVGGDSGVVLPDTDGSYVVWTDYRNSSNNPTDPNFKNYDIYLYDIVHPERGAVQITKDIHEQSSPIVFGNHVVWEDYRSGNADIYMCDYNPDTGVCPEQPITTSLSRAEFVNDVGDRGILWESFVGADPGSKASDSDIEFYDFSTKTVKKIAATSLDEISAALSPRGIVWQAGTWSPDPKQLGQNDIYFYNFSNGATSAITSSQLDEHDPWISGGHIIWTTDINDDISAIDSYDIDHAGAGITRIARGPDVLDYDAKGDSFVYFDSVYPDEDTFIGQLFLYNLNTNKRTLLYSQNDWAGPSDAEIYNSGIISQEDVSQTTTEQNDIFQYGLTPNTRTPLLAAPDNQALWIVSDKGFVFGNYPYGAPPSPESYFFYPFPGVTFTPPPEPPPPPPSVILRANGQTGFAEVTPGGSFTLSWDSSNAQNCTASGAWSGAKPLSGSLSINNVTSDQVYNLDCFQGTLSVHAQLQVGIKSAVFLTVGAYSNPQMTGASENAPLNIQKGDLVVLKWTSAGGVLDCKASSILYGPGNNIVSLIGDPTWTGAKLNSGLTLGAPKADTKYTISCAGTLGAPQSSVYVHVINPTVKLFLNGKPNPPVMLFGTPLQLSWISSGVDTCTASEGWSGNKSTRGMENVGKLNALHQTFRITCKNHFNYSAVDRVGPSTNSLTGADLQASTNASGTFFDALYDAKDGSPLFLKWSSIRASSCLLSGGGLILSEPTSGTYQTTKANVPVTYSLTCPGIYGTSTDSVYVGGHPVPVPDGGFEGDPTTYNEPFGTDTSLASFSGDGVAHSGKFSALAISLTPDEAFYSGWRTKPYLVPATPGKTYTATAWQLSGDARLSSIALSFWDGTLWTRNEVTQPLDDNGDWYQKKVTAQAPPNTQYMRVESVLWGTGFMRTDDIQISEANPTTESSNQLANGDFESGKNSWSGWSTNKRIKTDGSLNGSQHLEIMRGSAERTVKHDSLSVTGGNSYVLRGTIFGDGYIKAEWLNADGSIAQTDTLYTSDPSDETIRSTNGVVPANTKMVLSLIAESGSGVVSFDNVRLEIFPSSAQALAPSSLSGLANILTELKSTFDRMWGSFRGVRYLLGQ